MVTFVSPFLIFAALLMAAAIALGSLVNETTLIAVLIAAFTAMAILALRMYPAYLRKKTATAPKVILEGNVLSLSVLSGRKVAMKIDAATQIDFAYYHLHSTTTTGVMRGIWLELRRDDQRVLIVGRGDFDAPEGVETRKPGHAPDSERVSMFATDLLQLRKAIQKAA